MTNHGLNTFGDIRTAWGGTPNIFNQILEVANTGQLTDAERKKIIKREVLKNLETTRPADFEAMVRFRKTFPAEFNTAAPDGVSRPMWDATKASIYMQATNADNVASIKENGLDPSHGGQDNGAAKTQSVAAVQDQNVEEAKGKAYVTKFPTEAKRYYTTGQSQIILLYICDVCEETNTLKLDPDSQTGLYFTSPATGKAVADRAGANSLFERAIIGRARDLPNPETLTPEQVTAFVTAVLNKLVS